MTMRYVFLFHVLAALVFFVPLGVELATLTLMRRAKSFDELRRALGAFDLNTRLGPPALITILGTGVALAWSWRTSPPAWIVGAVVGLVAIAALGGAVTGRFVLGLQRDVTDRDGPLDAAIAARLAAPAPTLSFVARAAIVAGIAACMVLRPEPLVVATILVGAPLAAATIARMSHRRADAARAR